LGRKWVWNVSSKRSSIDGSFSSMTLIFIGLIDLTPKDRFDIVAPQKIDYAMN
jgi:hypothetical protein